jgi:hypothetical protein
MKDYAVTVYKPWFGGSKTMYISAESAEEVDKRMATELAYYIENEGVTYEIKSV